MSAPTESPSTGSVARRVILAIPLAVILFLALNAIIAIAGRSAKIDLTEDRRFTVSDATRKTLAGVTEPVTLRLYRSPGLIANAPILKIYAERVDEMLRAYRDLAHGKLVYEVIEPQPFSPEEDQAIGYRLRGFNIDQSGARGYFGLVGTNSLDGFERIDFFDPRREDSLEYDLTSVVKRLAQAHKPRVGVMDGLGMFGAKEMGMQPWAIVNMLEQPYDLRRMSGPDMSFDDIDVLMIVHPRNLKPRDLYRIDQFALSGKPVLVFIDPVYEALVSRSQKPPALEEASSSLDPLLAAWGVDMAAGKVAGDRNMALRVTAMAGRQRVLAPYAPWLQAREANFNHSDMATAKLRLMRISSAGALSATADATTKFSPLITTTTDSALLDASKVIQRLSPAIFNDDFKPGGKPLTIAARVTGPAKSVYPDGEPANPDDGQKPADAPKPPAGRTSGEVHVVVVADADILNDDHIINQAGQAVSNNGDFVMNVVDTLAGGAELASLRGRGVTPRPFTRIEAMEKQAEDLYRSREASLTSDLDKSQQELQGLMTRGARDGSDAEAISREQQGLIDNLNQKIVEIRRQLRDVRGALRADIDRLETRISLIDLLAVPFGLIAIGVATALWRRARLARYVAARAASGRNP